MKTFRALVASLISCGTLCFVAYAQTSTTAPPAHAVLVIQSTPGGAQVYVDDELLGTTSPEGRLKISTLRPGKHTLRLSLGGNSYGQGQFTLVAGKTLTKTVTLAGQSAAANPASSSESRGPTLQETYTWLVGKISAERVIFVATIGSGGTTGGYTDDTTYDKIVLSNCQANISYTHTERNWSGIYVNMNGGGYPLTDIRTWSLDLSKMSPNMKTKVYDGSELQAAQAGFPIAISGAPFVVQGEYAAGQPTQQLLLSSQDSATRVANAFNRAISLCGGKAAPF
jgi:hypothetical protein